MKSVVRRSPINGGCFLKKLLTMCKIHKIMDYIVSHLSPCSIHLFNPFTRKNWPKAYFVKHLRWSKKLHLTCFTEFWIRLCWPNKISYSIVFETVATAWIENTDLGWWILIRIWKLVRVKSWVLVSILYSKISLVKLGKTFRKINIPGHMMIYIWIAWFQQYISSNIFYKAGTNCFGTK